MPELAEVETVRKTLLKKLINKKISKIEVLYNNIIATDINEFKNNIINQEIKDIKRSGKYLIFVLNNYYLVSHLRMEGKYFIKNNSDPIIKHEHVIFYLNDNKTLRYHDTRKFGRMYLVPFDKLYTDTPLSNIGYDAINDTYYSNEIYHKYYVNKPIKELLLDQSIIAGIGNIYADEVLFASNINPKTKGNKLELNDIENIINNTKEILNKAIILGGTTIRSYTSSLGVYGSYQNELKVHQREGEKCYNCGSNIIKTSVGGRGTYYCPKCQEEK